MSPKVFVVSLWAQDLQAALRFYRDVIGLPSIAHHANRLHFDLSGAYLTVLAGKQEVLPDSPEVRFPCGYFGG